MSYGETKVMSKKNAEIRSKILYSMALATKRLFDIFMGIIGILMLIPISLIIKVCNLTHGDRGPVFYLHDRVGKNGKPFRLVKYRTMIVDADAKLEEILQKDSAKRKEWESVRKLSHDPRVTKIGHWLRVTSLDEFPNIVNVLTGSLSLVGPRPVMQDELERFGNCKDLILSVKPGMTGNWAVNGRSNTTYEERVAFEADYVKNWSLMLDIHILYETVRTVIKRKGAI